MQAQASRSAEWSWVLLAFVVANLTFAATQPVHPREGLGDEGQIYHAMAKAMPRELPPSGAAPFVYRFGMPLAAATVAKSLDWVITAGFDRLDLVFNALSVVFLTILLRRHVSSMFARIVVVVAFIVEPHSPVRLSYMHPLSTDSALMAGLLSGLLAIEWFWSRPSPARAAGLSLLVGLGVIFHELMLIVGLCVLFAPRLAGRSRFATLERTGAWLPLISGGVVLAGIHAWIEPTPAGSSMLSELVHGFSAKSVLQLPLALFLVFGSMLVLPAYFWRSTAGFLRERPMLLAYLVLCVAWAWSSRDHIERGFALASPIVYIVIARSLATAPLNPAGAGMAGLLLLQGLSSRVFSPIGGPIETPTVGNEVWERLATADVSWALSYPNMWAQLCATTMIPVYLAWFGITGAGVLMLLRGSRGDSATPVEPQSRRAPRNVVAPRLLLVGIASAAALAPIVWLALSRFYWDHYAQPGPAYLVYHLARVWLVAVLIAVFWATGSRIAAVRFAVPRAIRDQRGRWVEYAMTGAAAWSVLIVLLAALHLYYLWVALPLFAIATVFAILDIVDRSAATAAEENSTNRWGIAGISLRFSVAIHAVVILVGIVLLGHFGGDNDVPGNYLPYFESVLRDHTIAAGSYWVHFFASKGNGLAFLGNVLSDVQGAGLATFAMLLIGAGMIGGLVARASPVAPALGLIGACFFLQYYAGQGAYAKSHIIRNLFVLYIVLSGARLLLLHQALDAAGRAGRLVVIAAIIILSPLAVVLLLPILVIEWGLLAWSRSGTGVRRSLVEAGWALGMTAAVCAYNFFQTGLPELHNMPSFVSRFVSIERFGRWIDPGVAYLDSRLAFLQANLPGAPAAATSATNLVPTQSFAQALAALMSPAILALMAGAVVIGALAWLFTRRETADSPLHGAAWAVAYLLAVLVMLSALRMIGGGAGSSMSRFTDFANPLGIAIAIILLTAAWPEDLRSRRLVAGLIAVTAVIAIYLGSAPILALPWRSNVGFLIGQSSYASVNEFHWDTLTANRIARSLPAGSRADMLNFLPGMTAIPGTPFQRPDGCVYLKDYTSVLYESPERVAAIYAEYDIDHFLFDVSKDTPIVWSGFSELFTAESMRSRMQLVSHEQSATRDLYLLTWRNNPGLRDDGFETFLKRWSDKLAVEKAGGAFYGGFAYGAQQIGRRE